MCADIYDFVGRCARSLQTVSITTVVLAQAPWQPENQFAAIAAIGLNSHFFHAASTAFGYFGLPRLPL